MAEPRKITAADWAHWAAHAPQHCRFGPPPGVDDDACGTVEAFITSSDADLGRVVRVPWQLTADEIATLAAGGTIWLSTWGGLPPHQVEVAP